MSARDSFVVSRGLTSLLSSFCVADGACPNNRPQAPDSGFVSFNNGDADGSVATFSCSPGKALNGTASVNCTSPGETNGTWFDPLEQPFCNGSWLVLCVG